MLSYILVCGVVVHIIFRAQIHACEEYATDSEA